MNRLSLAWGLVSSLGLAACETGGGSAGRFEVRLDASTAMAGGGGGGGGGGAAGGGGSALGGTIGGARDAPGSDALAGDATRGSDAGLLGQRVEIDLTGYLDPLPGAAGSATARVAAGPDDLLAGTAAQGRPGDWVLENERVRFVIERAARVIGPCPWGGNVIDAAMRLPDGRFSEDVVGEGCLFLNVAQTTAPDAFEVMSDAGAGAAVLAVTSHLELLDFIHLQGMIDGFLPGGAVRIPWDTENPPAMTVTQYYILRPGDQGVRVITAMRNDGLVAVHSPFGYVIDSGGSVEFFNPSSTNKGFGYRDLSAATLTGDPLTLLAFRGERGSHAYFPEPVPELSGDLPISGLYIAVAGVAAALLGRDELLGSLLPAPAQIEGMPGLLHLPPGATDTRVHWQYAGTGALSTMLDSAWRDVGVATGALEGLIRGAGAGGGVADARVSAVDALGRTLNQAMSGPDGSYSMRVPAGRFSLRAYAGNQVGASVAVDVAVDAVVTSDVRMPDAGVLRVALRRPDGRPTPGKVTVMCEGPCRNQPQATERDVSFDGPLEGSAATVFVGVSGAAEIPLTTGAYRVTVSRGMEWSVWPPDAVQAGGRLISVEAGLEVALTAEIAHVVDSAGAVTGDFHVHAVPSPDSPISLEDRVRSFMAEGVDVIVSTDHDVITDYTPVIEALGAGEELGSVIGLELTTFDYGHYNGFPLTRDDSPNGGAFDWAGGAGLGKTPAEIFDWYATFPGDQVIQINHPDSGYFRILKLDALRGLSHGDPADFRLPPREPAPGTGDTGLWDEGFTAIEMLNGYSMSKFNGILHWWLAMVGRGFTPTATAVSDTHKSLLSQAGGPRSYILVDGAHDTAASMDPADLAANVNAGRLIGTTGPYMRVTAHNSDGESAGLGETLAAVGGQSISISVVVDVPAWMRVDTVELYGTITEGLDVGAGAVVEEAIPPTATQTFTLTPEDLRLVAEGEERHEHYVRTVTMEYSPPVGSDGYVVVMLRQTGEGTMFPVLHKASAKAFAFSNPIYLDTDGGGYDHPPLAALARSPFEARRLSSRPSPAVELPHVLTVEELKHLLRETAHDH